MNAVSPRPGRPWFARHKRGTAAAELALILPMIMLLALGALEFGRVFQAWVVATAASREGARQAALGMSVADVRSQVVLPYLEASGLGPSIGVQLPAPTDIVVTPDSGQPGELVSVYVPLWVQVSVPLVSRLLPSNPLKVGVSTTARRQ